jgi:class 3 adenylate cyclase
MDGMRQPTEPNEKSFRGFVRTLAIWAAIALTVVLGFHFYLMLYFPGTPQTSGLFRAVVPYWTLISYTAYILQSPVHLLAQGFLLLLPPAWKNLFPEMSAALLMSVVTHHPLAVCQSHYPGQLVWLDLLAIVFWNCLLCLMCQCFWYLQDNRNVGDSVGAALVSWKEKQRRQAFITQNAAEPPLPPSSAPSFGSVDSSAASEPPQNTRVFVTRDVTPTPPPAPSSRLTDSRMLDRLSQSKQQPANPSIIIPREMTSHDWEAYKQEQGDFMVRDMLRQLQRENSNLHAQQQQLRSTFSQYFSPNVAHYLESNKGTFQNVSNQTHRVSVLFCDIRGFSSYSQSASSDEVLKFLSEYFEIASHFILQRYNGVISKLMGDGFMAYWGFPVPDGDHAYVATRAALDILHEVALRNHIKSGKNPLNIGIGIATGEALIGNIGSDDFKDFTLIGPTVNMASRLEEANKRLNTSLLISGATYEALQGRLPCQNCGKVEIRGWDETQPVYAPVLKKLEI